MVKNVKFISEWNGGFEVVTNAKYNEETGEIFDIELYDGELIDEDGDELEYLDAQYIELESGKRLEAYESENDNCEYAVQQN